jgi:hypothetical protein
MANSGAPRAGYSTSRAGNCIGSEDRPRRRTGGLCRGHHQCLPIDDDKDLYRPPAARQPRPSPGRDRMPASVELAPQAGDVRPSVPVLFPITPCYRVKRRACDALSERANGCSASLTCRSTALIRIPLLPLTGPTWQHRVSPPGVGGRSVACPDAGSQGDLCGQVDRHGC